MIIKQNTFSKNPERVVLLGASGFIGAVLKRQLELQDVTILAPTSEEVNLAAVGARSLEYSDERCV